MKKGNYILLLFLSIILLVATLYVLVSPDMWGSPLTGSEKISGNIGLLEQVRQIFTA
ncbi:MAG: hypothetical protein AAGC85_19835 [Bacteroidota bacterium]